jgi:hypothetical protein
MVMALNAVLNTMRVDILVERTEGNLNCHFDRSFCTTDRTI